MSLEANYCLRKTPQRDQILAEREKNQLVIEDVPVPQKRSQCASWKDTASSVAKLACLLGVTSFMFYNLYTANAASQNVYEQNTHLGRESMRGAATEIMHEIAKANPQVVCMINNKIVELMQCYYMGLTNFNQ